MPKKWERDPEDLVIAHISDIHMGCSGVDEPWKMALAFLKTDVQPSLVIVSGDLVDSPKGKLYAAVKEDLDHNFENKYFVCPGNHDRHKRGNKGYAGLNPIGWFKSSSGALFDQIFQAQILSVASPKEISIGPETNRWKIGLAGVDSSLKADWSARGYVLDSHFRPTESASLNKDWDLFIFAVHHHLYPIRELERQRQGSLANLFQLTPLVNAGTLLEVLARSRVDLVLHGHEHAHNWAQYESMNVSRGKVKVIGAGSVTGNKTGEGGSLSRASLNLIRLSPRRTGILDRIKYEDGQWEVSDHVVLLDASEVRQSSLRRRYAIFDSSISGEVIKIVTFNLNRDINVRWIFSRKKLSNRVVHNIGSWVGSFDEESLVARLETEDGEIELLTASSRISENSLFTHEIVVDVPFKHASKVATLEITYVWRSAGALTQGDLRSSMAGSNARGPHRSKDLEFSTILVSEPVSKAELIVSIPPDYAPDKMRIHVGDPRDANASDLPHEAAEFERSLRKLSDGIFNLRISYPKPEREYSLTWMPIVDETVLSHDIAVTEGVTKNAQELLKEFAAVVTKNGLGDTGTVALYAATPQTVRLSRVGVVMLRQNNPVTSPQMTYELNAASVVTQAWQGVPVMVRERPKDQGLATSLGFTDNETALFAVPIRFAFDWANPSPVAVVRVGIIRSEDESSGHLSEAKIGRVLAAAATSLLSRLFEVAV